MSIQTRYELICDFFKIQYPSRKMSWPYFPFFSSYKEVGDNYALSFFVILGGNNLYLSYLLMILRSVYIVIVIIYMYLYHLMILQYIYIIILILSFNNFTIRIHRHSYNLYVSICFYQPRINESKKSKPNVKCWSDE